MFRACDEVDRHERRRELFGKGLPYGRAEVDAVTQRRGVARTLDDHGAPPPIGAHGTTEPRRLLLAGQQVVHVADHRHRGDGELRGELLVVDNSCAGLEPVGETKACGVVTAVVAAEAAVRVMSRRKRVSSIPYMRMYMCMYSQGGGEGTCVSPRSSGLNGVMASRGPISRPGARRPMNAPRATRPSQASRYGLFRRVGICRGSREPSEGVIYLQSGALGFSSAPVHERTLVAASIAIKAGAWYTGVRTSVAKATSERM